MMMLTVFGSINIDQVIRVPTIPKPGETTLGERIMDTCGGKGANQAVAAARVTTEQATVTMIGALGEDEHGRRSLENLRENGVLTECVEYADCATGTAIISVSNDGENAITVVSGANAKLEHKHASKETLKKTSTLLCQGETSLLETWKVIAAFRKTLRDGVVVVNLAPVPQNDDLVTLKHVLDNCDILVVNEQEAHSILHLLTHSEPDDLMSIVVQFDIQILITRGAEGAELLSPVGPVLKVSSPTIDPIDTTGAGDTFCGVFAALLAEGQQIETAMNIACEAAAKACCAVGAQSAMPYRHEILKTAQCK